MVANTYTRDEQREVSSMERSELVLRLENVRKSYGDVEALRGVNLEISKGEFVTLLGPSGSGKTTTLNIIAGFVAESGGAIELDGRELGGTPPNKRDIGMVFQNYALFPHMTVGQNIAFPLKQRKISRQKIQKKVEEVLESVRLDGYADRKIGELSGGQQQRIALARAIVFQPRLLLMDEPLGALDKKLRDWLQLEIKRIHRESGTTFIYVTHDQEEAMVLSDKIAIFNDGVIEQVGTPQSLYGQPTTLFSGTFMGESTVFPGKITDAATDGYTGIAGTSGAQYRGHSRLQPGSSVCVLVRPEAFRIVDPSIPAPPQCNSVDAMITERVYLGHMIRYKAVTSDGVDATVAGDPAASVFYNYGDNVRLCWRYEDGVVLKS